MFLYLYLYLCLFLRDIMNGVITFVKEKSEQSDLADKLNNFYDSNKPRIAKKIEKIISQMIAGKNFWK